MKTSKSTQTTEREEAFALWDAKTNGGLTYYTGKTSDNAIRLVAFVNTTKKNPNQPDIQVYEQTEKGKEKNQVASLWKNKSKSNKYYYSGQDNEGIKIFGFDNNNTQGGKYPAIRVYYSEK